MIPVPLPPAPAPPVPPRREVYFQLRATDREDQGSFGSFRRIRVNLGGGDSKTAWFVQLFGKGGNRSSTDEKLYLQDAWVRTALPAGATLTLGQVRPPFSRERLTGDRQLLLPDRPTAVDAIMPNGGLSASFARDLGVLWNRGPLSVGLYGGNGTLQQKGHGSGPLIAARWVQPAQYGLSVGLSAAFRAARHFDASRAFPGTKSMGFDRFTGDDTRLSLEAAWHAGNWQTIGEWLQADLRGTGRLRASGGYLLVAHEIASGWQAVARLESFDPNRALTDRNDTRTVVLGVNCVPKRHPRDRWQLAYTHRHEAVNGVRNDGVVLQWQHWLGGD
jgi:phosphate-selective porin